MGRDSGWKPQTPRQQPRHLLGRCVAVSQEAHVLELHDGRDRLVFIAAAALMAVRGLVGAVLAVPLSRASGGERAGDSCRARSTLMPNTPALVAPPDDDARRRGAAGRRAAPVGARSRLAARAYRRQSGAAPDRRGHPDPFAFTAGQKLKDARSLDEALAWLSPVERVEVAGDQYCSSELARLPDSEHPAVFDLKEGKK